MRRAVMGNWRVSIIWNIKTFEWKIFFFHISGLQCLMKSCTAYPSSHLTLLYGEDPVRLLCNGEKHHWDVTKAHMHIRDLDTMKNKIFDFFSWYRQNTLRFEKLWKQKKQKPGIIHSKEEINMSITWWDTLLKTYIDMNLDEVSASLKPLGYNFVSNPSSFKWMFWTDNDIDRKRSVITKGCT